MGDDHPTNDRIPPNPGVTAELLTRIRAGDELALNHLVSVYAPVLTRWAHGRLPLHARGLSDTEDLVQITLVRVLRNLEGLDARRPGAFLAYLRGALLNNLRNEIRNAGRRPRGAPAEEHLPASEPSPLEQAIGRQALEAYEEALEKLTEEQRIAVVLRIELGCRHQEIADLLGSPSANAARMLVSRGIARLSEVMTNERPHDGTGQQGAD